MDELIQKNVTIDPKIQHGKPCFRGTRVPIYAVLELLEGGVKPEEIVSQAYYPNLNLEHVKSALHFAAQWAKNQEYFPFEQST